MGGRRDVRIRDGGHSRTAPGSGRPRCHPGPAIRRNGLHTALSAFGRPLVVVAVDQPLVRSETLLRLAGLAAEGETAICIDDRPQVTCASYTPACLEEATRQLRSGGSIQQMLRSVPWTPIRREVWSRWGEDGRSWFSMDTPDSIITAEQRFRLNLLG